MLNQTNFEFKYNIRLARSPNMSQEPVSPRLMLDKKSSIKKSNKPDQSKSKKKPVEFNQSPIPESQNTAQETPAEEAPEPKPCPKLPKREVLRIKADSSLKEHLKQAEKSEKSAKMMKSTDRASTIKEHHNQVESNQREFSLSKEPPEALELSKKKIATESKKNKIQDTNSKHPKTEEKVLNKDSELDKIEETNKGTNEVAHQAEIVQQDPTANTGNQELPLVEIKISNEENQKDKGNTNSKKIVSIAKQGKFSKKRLEPARSAKETEEASKDAKQTKSVKKPSKSAAKSAANSKDSRGQQGKSGVKKLKQNEKI